MMGWRSHLSRRVRDWVDEGSDQRGALRSCVVTSSYAPDAPAEATTSGTRVTPRPPDPGRGVFLLGWHESTDVMEPKRSGPKGDQMRGQGSGIPVTGAQSLIRSLESAGADTVFGIPGGAILPAYDPLYDSVKLRHILVRHEQGAGHAASGYATATGRVGVCMATSGPGATNLVTPIADAYMDSVPMVAVTGQVASGSIGTDAFQEADISGITLPITKHNFLVTNPADIPRTIAEAFHIAGTGRPGPVLVDVSKDALQAATRFAWPDRVDLPGYRPVTRPHNKQVREAARLMLEAKRPVLYV